MIPQRGVLHKQGILDVLCRGRLGETGGLAALQARRDGNRSSAVSAAEGCPCKPFTSPYFGFCLDLYCDPACCSPNRYPENFTSRDREVGRLLRRSWQRPRLYLFLPPLH